MSGVYWLILAWAVVAVFLISVCFRVLIIARLPVHLRWELAPIPTEKGKGRYGGSYLEEYEWWTRRRRKSVIAPLVYMAEEIFLMRGIWRNNRPLWPFSVTLHGAIYLFAGSILLQALAIVLSFHGLWRVGSETCLRLSPSVAGVSCCVGTAGTLGLLGKRLLDRDLRWSNTVGTIANLLFLGTVFVSGGIVWLGSANSMLELHLFITAVISFDPSVTLASPLSIHVVLTLLFCAYLPFTNMFHFIAKYFMYHGVRWNDSPHNSHMERRVRGLLNRTVSWSAEHAECGREATWNEIVSNGNDDKKTSP
jgi:nitrate reductase gamma subunit